MQLLKLWPVLCCLQNSNLLVLIQPSCSDCGVLCASLNGLQHLQGQTYPPLQCCVSLGMRKAPPAGACDLPACGFGPRMVLGSVCKIYCHKAVLLSWLSLAWTSKCKAVQQVCNVGGRGDGSASAYRSALVEQKEHMQKCFTATHVVFGEKGSNRQFDVLVPARVANNRCIVASSL
jgi:hypothetical protein